MKNLKNLFLLVLTLSVISFTSCSSSDDGGDNGGAASGTITAKIDGSNFTSLQLASTANLVSSAGTLTMQGNDADGRGFVFVINGYEGVGTYDIGGDNLIAVTAGYTEINISNPANTQTWQAPFDDTVAGTISFSEDTGSTVIGTFQFTCKNSSDNSTKSITDGAFNLDVMMN